MDKTENHSFVNDGITLAGVALLTNETLKICNDNIPDYKVYLLALSSVLGGFLLDRLFKEKEEEKLFRMCGIENKDKQIPLIIKKQTKDRQTTSIIHLPPGISQSHFEKKQQELEQGLNAKIEWGFNKNLIMKSVTNTLKSNYPYIFEQCEKPLEVYCGECNGNKFYLDIEKCPHIIVAGETDSGKSSFLDNIVLSLILSKHNIDLHLIDFQAVGLGIFENCKKVMSYGEKPTEFEKLLDSMEEENDKRLKLFRSIKNKVYIEKLSIWNKKFPEKSLPYIVCVIDEFARLSESQYEGLLEKFRTRVSMDRKTGIHYIVSMQRPDVKCISGSIKANMPTRIAFKTFSQVDSEVILDQGGAEKLKDQGRFLIKYCGQIQEVQGLYIENDGVRGILKKAGKYKTAEDLENEHKEKMKALRDKCINPYLKGEKL